MQDRIVPHVGVEWRAFAQRRGRGSCAAATSTTRAPSARRPGPTNYVDSDRHVFSAGSACGCSHPGAVLPGDVRFDVHGQLSVLPDTTIVKQDPSDPVGNYTAGGHIWNFGGTATVGF